MKFLIVFTASAMAASLAVAAIPSKRSDADENDITVVNSDDCVDELNSCAALIDNGGMDCTTSGAQDFCKKSCNACDNASRMKKRAETKKMDVCYDELAHCEIMIEKGSINCQNSGKTFCAKTCNACGIAHDITVVNSDDCRDELSYCKTLIGIGGMDCSTSGAQEWCRESCNTCSPN